MGGNNSAIFGKHHSLTGTDYLTLAALAAGGAYAAPALMGGAGAAAGAGGAGMAGMGGGTAALFGPEAGSLGAGLIGDAATGAGTGLGSLLGAGAPLGMETAAPGVAGMFGPAAGAEGAGLIGDSAGMFPGGVSGGSMFSRLLGNKAVMQGAQQGLSKLSQPQGGPNMQNTMPAPPQGGPIPQNVPSGDILSSFYGNKPAPGGTPGMVQPPGVGVTNLDIRKRLAALGLGGY